MGTTAKLAGRAMQTTHACNWATMKRKKKRKKKKPPKASEGKERQRSPGFTRKAQKYNKGSMYKTKRAESNSKVEMNKVRAMLLRFLLNVTLKHSLSLFNPFFHSPLTPNHVTSSIKPRWIEE